MYNLNEIIVYALRYYSCTLVNVSNNFCKFWDKSSPVLYPFNLKSEHFYRELENGTVSEKD